MTVQWLPRILGLCVVLSLIIFLSACPNGVTATTPVNFQLEIPTTTLGVYGTTGPTSSATATSPQGYQVLPLLTTSTVIVRAYLTTPYPTSLTIVATDNSSGASVTLPQVSANSPGPATGYYQVISVGTTNPTQWHIVIRYPDSFMSSRLITTAITDVAGSQASAPFTFALISNITTVKVNIVSANGDGMVTSNPAGVNCTTTTPANSMGCNFDSKGFSSMVLSQSVLHNQTEFTGWQGNCTGTGNCNLTLNGTTVKVTANFRVHTNTAPTTLMCPAAPIIPGKTFVENPNCGTIPTNLGATLACDAQGFFCCGSSTTTQQDPTMRCHGQNLTLVTCAPDNTGNMGNNELLLPTDIPLGCYVSDTSP